MKNITVPKVAYSIKINKKKLEQNKLPKIELDYYLMMIISICFGAASDFREYLLLNNLINTVSYQITEIDTHYLIDFFATSTKPEQLLQELITYLNNLKIAKQDLERIKKVWISQEVKMLDNNDAIINTIIDDILDYGKYINNKIEIIKNMNYETLEKVLKSLDYTNTSSLIILPNN